jgi:hypothetical protein
MTGDQDEDFVSNKELHDMMKAMIELLTKNQASTTTISPSTTVIISFQPFLLMMVLISINILLGK